MSVAFAAPEIRDVRPPVNFPPNYALIWILLALGLLAFVIYFIRYLLPKLKKSVIKTTPPKTAWELAYERLAILARENLPQRGLVNEFYTRLSRIVRYYLEDRFLIRAPEMTTEEFLFSLRSAAQLNEKHKSALREFLNFSDMVKFARHPASVADMAQGFALAQRLVDETRLVENELAVPEKGRG